MALLQGDREEFVDCFSRIHIIRNTSPPAIRRADEWQLRINGHSTRNVASPFITKCKNYIFGCDFTSVTPNTTMRHEKICKVTSDNPQDGTQNTYSHLYEKCGTYFRNPVSLRAHKRIKHFIPRACSVEGCLVLTVFTDFDSWTVHCEMHDGYTPQSCSITGCSSKTFFRKSNYYRQHLKAIHKMSFNEITAHIAALQHVQLDATSINGAVIFSDIGM